MNRSHRRTAVMRWSITVAAVCGVAGLLGAAPTAAETDAGGPGPSGAHGRDGRSDTDARRAGRDGGTETQRGRPTAADRRAADDRPSDEDDRDCHRWPYWPPLPLPDTDPGNRNAFFAGGDEAAAVAPPLAIVTATTIFSPPGVDGLIGAETAIADPQPPAGSVAPAAASAPLTAGTPAPGGGPMIPSPPPPSPAATPPSRRPAPVAVPATTPVVPFAPPQARTVGVAEAAAGALPGLIGLTALAGAGGLLGYRQAKAGFALRAAGTARFLP